MKIIGINPSHNSTAALLIDGKIISCISEERITRYKNESGYPVLSINFLLKENNLKPSDIDYVAVSMCNPTAYIHYREDKTEYSKKSRFIKFTILFHIFLRPIIDKLMQKFTPFGKIYQTIYSLTYAPIMWNLLRPAVYKEFKDLGFGKKQIVFIDHHEAHAMSAYCNMPGKHTEKILVMTADGEGDGVCATVSIISENVIKWLARTKSGNSLAMLYGGVTEYLGMNMNDHEYKVMGLAAYTKPKEIKKVVDKIKDLIWINEKKLTFESLFHSYVYIHKDFLHNRLKWFRFDSIAGGLQEYTEELIIKWVKAAVQRTGIKKIAFGGGLFLNIKLNKRIAELPQINELFFMPSAGDESTAIGAAQAYYFRLSRNNQTLAKIVPLKDLYLGPQFSNEEIKQVLNKLPKNKYKIQKFSNIEDKIAEILIKGNAVARFSGRMEWGARALGNRSILADPSNLKIIRIINDQIKSRDFWMPFACSILRGREKDYVVNPKKIPAPYMILGFRSTQKAQQELIAGMHQYDLTIRPQIVDEEWNPGYYKVIKAFEKKTGIGGVLNTSFNLHGAPIVCSPKDALYVFQKSGLEYLALGNYLISKY